MARVWKDRIVENPRTFSVQNNPDGTITLIPAPGQVAQEGTPVNAAMLNGIEKDLTELSLISSNIKGTVAQVTFVDGKAEKIDHKRGVEVVRQDIFTYSDNIITETRTILETNETITFKYHLDTLEIEVI